MSYDVEELQTGILEMFADTTRLSRYKTDPGELHPAVYYRSRPLTDEELLEEARNAKPLPRIHKPLPAPRISRRVSRWQPPRIVQISPVGYWARLSCPHCGARSAAHRCPAYVPGERS